MCNRRDSSPTTAIHSATALAPNTKKSNATKGTAISARTECCQSKRGGTQHKSDRRVLPRDGNIAFAEGHPHFIGNL
jgi:hypothetical protein